jgi:hypothetical protein
MMVRIEKRKIEVPAILGGWIVQKVIPLEYINSTYARNRRRLQVFYNLVVSLPNKLNKISEQEYNDLQTN